MTVSSTASNTTSSAASGATSSALSSSSPNSSSNSTSSTTSAISALNTTSDTTENDSSGDQSEWNSGVDSKAAQQFSELLTNESAIGDTLESIYDTRTGQRQDIELSDLFNPTTGDLHNSMDSADERTETGFWEDPLAWAGNKIDQAVHGAEKTVDGWRKDMVAFGEEHGGFVGKTVAKGVAAGIGFVEGVDLAAYDMVAGAASLAHGISKVTDPIEWMNHPDENRERVETAFKVVDTLNKVATPAEWLTNPEGNLKIAGALWDGLTYDYQQAAKEGDWAKFSGRLTVDVGSLFFGTGEVKAAEKGAEAANAAAHMVEGTVKVAVVETAEGLNALEHTAKNAVRIGDAAAETVNVAGKTVGEIDMAAISANEVELTVTEIGGPKTTKVYGSAANPRVEWRKNIDGVTRTKEEVIKIAEKAGIDIEMMDLHLVDDLPDQVFASYTGLQGPPDKLYKWNDIVHDITEKVPVRINKNILNSDEAIIATLQHESYELEALQDIMQSKGMITQRELGSLIDLNYGGELHNEAWDVADKLILKLRGE